MGCGADVALDGVHPTSAPPTRQQWGGGSCALGGQAGEQSESRGGDYGTPGGGGRKEGAEEETRAQGRHLVAGVHGADVAHVQVVQGHEQLRAQGAVVHVARPQEEGPQELQHHVVQLHVLPHHLRQLLHHLRGETPQLGSPRTTAQLLPKAIGPSSQTPPEAPGGPALPARSADSGPVEGTQPSRPSVPGVLPPPVPPPPAPAPLGAQVCCPGPQEGLCLPSPGARLDTAGESGRATGPSESPAEDRPRPQGP